MEPSGDYNWFTTRSGRLVRSQTLKDNERKKLNSYIYLDLSQPVAIVNKEPAAAADVDEDPELNRCLRQFLGLSTRRRHLYNPSESFEPIEATAKDEQKTDPSPVNTTPVNKPRSQRQLVPCQDEQLLQLFTLKLLEDSVQRLNASYFEQQTSPTLKQPIQLDNLPGEKQCARFCNRHKRQVQQLQQHHLYKYSFLSSLSPATPLIMCHPLALGFRQSTFHACKTSLAQSLFGLFNHVIFHCGLPQHIEWPPKRNSPSRCMLNIDADGQRRARFQLGRKISETGVLIETLLHEMCHAAAFIYNGETSHGDNTRRWAYRAKSLLPQLPRLGDCASSFKYSCVLCRRGAWGNLRFRGQQQLLRCFHCQFELIVSAHDMPATALPATPYADFIRAHYLNCEQSGHSSKMRALNARFLPRP